MFTQARDPGTDLADLHAADFGPGVAHQFTLDKPLEPGVLRRLGLSIEAVFDKGKVTAQCLRQVGIGGGQFDQQFKQLGQGSAGAPVLHRHAHGAKAGFLQPFHLLKGQAAVLLALQCAGGDAGKDRPEARGQGLVVGAAGEGVWQVLLLDGHGAAPYEGRESNRAVAYGCQCTGRA
ncbi:hypothetical protein D3C86_1558190 [compost metagenome]